MSTPCSRCRQQQGLVPGTIKNCPAVLRWWAEKVGRAWVLARDPAKGAEWPWVGVEARLTVLYQRW